MRQHAALSAETAVLARMWENLFRQTTFLSVASLTNGSSVHIFGSVVHLSVHRAWISLSKDVAETFEGIWTLPTRKEITHGNYKYHRRWRYGRGDR